MCESHGNRCFHPFLESNLNVFPFLRIVKLEEINTGRLKADILGNPILVLDLLE
jgi:hypothetical protein